MSDRADHAPAACSGASDWSRPLPLDGWFLVAPSRRLRAGRVLAFELPGLPVVLYRGEDGVVRAVQAHCPHMGAHLRHATVHGNALQCPLHHWRWQPGTESPPPGTRCLPGLPVRETGSGIWIGHSRDGDGAGPSFPGPDAATPDELRYRLGRPVFLHCPWQAVMANAFDLNHFGTVHQRAMQDLPEIRDHGDRLDFNYTSRVVGSGLPDRVMRRISGDRIQVAIKLWQGGVITVHTRTRKRDTFLWLSALPVDGGTLVTPVYAVRRDELLSPLRLRVAAWLFDAFLRKDIAILDRMQFSPKVTEEEDRYLWTYLRFVERHAGGSRGGVAQPGEACHVR